MAGDWMVPHFSGTVQLKGGTPGLTRHRGEGGPQIAQPPLLLGPGPIITMVIRRCGHIALDGARQNSSSVMVRTSVTSG